MQTHFRMRSMYPNQKDTEHHNHPTTDKYVTDGNWTRGRTPDGHSTLWWPIKRTQCNAIITAMDVFSWYFFAYNVVRTDTKTVARVLTDKITRFCHLPTTILTDKASQLTSETIEQTTKALGIQLKHATTKHAQTTEILENTTPPSKETSKSWHEKAARCGINSSQWLCKTKTQNTTHPWDVTRAELFTAECLTMYST